MYFYIMVILAVLFAQYATEMRRVEGTLEARQQTWAYQCLKAIQYVFESVKQLVKPAGEDDADNQEHF